jgi:hypothetical protein
MRCGLISLTFAISIVPVVANAQLTIDMGKITCGQYLAMPPSQSDNFSAWMSGWFSYQNRRTFVDLLLHQRNIATEGMVPTPSGGKCHVWLATIGRHKLTAREVGGSL